MATVSFLPEGVELCAAAAHFSNWINGAFLLCVHSKFQVVILMSLTTTEIT